MKPAVRPSTQPPAAQRRRLLGAIGIAGTAAITAKLVAPREPQVEATGTPAPPSPGEPSRGYRLSEHVQRYYRSARA